MLAAAVGVFLLVSAYGERLTPATTNSDACDNLAAACLERNAAPRAGGTGGRYGSGAGVGLVLPIRAQLPVIGRSLRAFCSALRCWAGSPDAAVWILPQSVRLDLGIISQLGVVVYMFTVGLELNAACCDRGHERPPWPSPHAEHRVPLRARHCAGVAALSHARSAPRAVHAVRTVHGHQHVGNGFSGAGPNSELLENCRHTPLGVMRASSCAASDDVTAWCLAGLRRGRGQGPVRRGLADPRADGGLHLGDVFPRCGRRYGGSCGQVREIRFPAYHGAGAGGRAYLGAADRMDRCACHFRSLCRRCRDTARQPGGTGNEPPAGKIW